MKVLTPKDLLKGYSLREFKIEDLDQVIDINLHCLPEHYPPSFYLDLHQRFPEAFLVAETEEGEIVGYIMCRVEMNFPSLDIFRGLKKGHIISIAVREEHRGRGIGSALIERALKALRDVYGCRECYLEVRVSNYKAIRLYEKMGFTKLRLNPFYYRDGEAAYTMTRKL